MSIYHPGIATTEHTLYRGRLWLQQRVQVANLIGLVGGVVALLCLLLVPTPWNMLIPLYLALIVWCIICPRVTLYLLPLAVPWGYLDAIVGRKLPLSSADLLVGLLITGWLLGFVLRPLLGQRFGSIGVLDREESQVPRYLIFALGALLATMALSLVNTFSLSLSLKELVKWLEVAVVILLGTQYLRTRRQIWTLVVILCLAALSQALLGYIQNFFALGPASFIRADSLRVYGTFDQPNPYAGYIDMALMITLALTLLSKSALPRLLAGATTLILAYASYLAQSNGGQIALAAAVLFVLFVGMPRLRPVLWVGGIALFALFGAYLIGALPTFLLKPILKLLKLLGLVPISLTTPSSDDFSVAERLAHWYAGLHMFRDHPFTGVGIGNYAQAYPAYHITIFANPLGHAHNYYINIAAETGIFGLLAFLLFIAALFVAGAQTYQHINKKYLQVRQQRRILKKGTTVHKARLTLQRMKALAADRALAVGLLASLLSVCVHNTVDNLYVHSMTILFALLLVLLVSLQRVTVNIDKPRRMF